MSDCKLTKEIAEIIYAYLENGCTYETAAQAVGIHRNTLRNWIERGEKGETEYQDFVHNIYKVRAKAELKYVGVIEKATMKDWNAARWMLTHMNPEVYGESSRQQIEHTGSVDSNIIYEYKVIKDDSTVSPPVITKTTTSDDGK